MIAWLSLGLWLGLWALPAGAEEQSCKVVRPLEGQRLLRRMSLDLRGVTPTYEETLLQQGQDKLSDSTIDAALASPDFRATMRRYHQSLLWPNVSQVELSPNPYNLIGYAFAENDIVYFSPLRAVFVRTISGELFRPCKNEPARFDADGLPIADPLVIGGETVAYQEGWVMVEPYWAPGTQVKVCAYDAQPAAAAAPCPGPASRYPFLAPSCEAIQSYAAATQTPFTGATVDCSGPFGSFAPGCGCGPNLRMCTTPETLATLQQSMLDQELKIIDDVIAEDRPYTDVLLTKQLPINGPLAHYLKYQSRLSFDLYGDPDSATPIPEALRFSDPPDQWTRVTRGGRHSGVLTTPGYLLRFQSNRARAHRYYNAFECSSFIPAGSLPSPFEPCSQHEDLTKRCGCDACHKQLEPLASHWGRFAEYGFAPIDDQTFPKVIGSSCAAPFSSMERLFRCTRFYKLDVVGDEVPFRYDLNAYVFRTPTEVENIEAGPSHLVQSSIESGAFATCTTRKMWTQLMRRSPSADEEATVIPGLAESFKASGYKLKSLVKTIIQNPAYGRAQ
ncbi:MAG: hypothetical protein U1E65_05835 [Myxococcota bacterium]